MKPEFESILPEVRRPSRYLGNEINAVRKDLSEVDLRIALGYPDTYEIGMSHIGTQILYHLLNDQPWIACERVYAPWPDMEAKLKEKNLPLTTLESNLPLHELDILGITLPYELTYTNILTILRLAKIPFYSKDRDETFPLILGGGTGAYNPEPVADFFDAILVGDGEEAILEICEVVREWKGGGAIGRSPLLQNLSKIRGVYVPSFFEPVYQVDGTLKENRPLLQGYSGIRKRVVSDLDKAYYPHRPILPHAKVIHERVGVEVQRGCVRGCRFCQAGTIDRPERQRSPETVKEIVRDQLNATGQDEVSLVSLSIGDYDCLAPLLKDLMDEHAAQNVAVSIPATRVEQLTPPILEEIKRVRKTGFTIAPEAATDRMRQVINKGNSEENLMNTTRAVFSHGWRLMKFYFMIGLPTETDEDVTEIARLGHRTLHEALKLNRQAEINLGVSAFVPKPFTPFQWETQDSLEETRRKLRLIRSQLFSRRIHLKPHRAETTYLEGIFARGDRRLSRLIVRAWEKGCRFDEWDEGLKFDLWREAWEECGIDPHFYVERRRGREECLPWDHLFVEMKKDWLWEEYEASLKTAFIDDCSTGKCTVCGVCDYKQVRNRSYELPRYNGEGEMLKRKTTTEVRFYAPLLCKGTPPLIGGDVPQGQRGRMGRGEVEQGTTPPHLPLQRGGVPLPYQCTYTKTGPAAYLSHLEFVDHIRRAVSRAGLPIRFSQGFHPLPRISFEKASPVGQEVHASLTLQLLRAMEPGEIKSRLNQTLPEGIRIVEVQPIPSCPRSGQGVNEEHDTGGKGETAIAAP